MIGGDTGALWALNATTGEPAWPIWPMPAGETCVTTLDALKRHLDVKLQGAAVAE